jgi:acid phosphatase
LALYQLFSGGFASFVRGGLVLRYLLRLVVPLLSLAVLAASPGSSDAADQTALLRQKIQHVIVIYLENWSFDALYSKFPHANGSNATTRQFQYGRVDPQTGTCQGPDWVVMTAVQQQPLLGQANPLGPWPCGWVDAKGLFSVAAAGGSNPDPSFSSTIASGGLPVQPYNLSGYDPIDSLTGDLWHIFWHEQMQIDTGTLEPSNGRMDKFVAYGGNPGYVLSYYDASNLPEGQLAQRFTMADDFFHSAYGGSFLNHQWLICACTPHWNQALPASNTTSFESYWNPATKTLRDGNLTFMPVPQTAPGPSSAGRYYVVNTTYSQNLPHPIAFETNPAARDQLLAPIPSSQKTIGDLLTDHKPSIGWKWYSGGWDLALQMKPNDATRCQTPPPTANNPPTTGECFQYHHQPFAYYERWGSSSPANFSAHLQDETHFFGDLRTGRLPGVSFIKPVGVDNDHPNYSDIIAGQLHVAQLVDAVCRSPYWKTSAIIITYDENGGRWDHVTPPHIDEWGAGTRVPAIIISPYAKPHFVDHTQYETVSILSFIEKRFGLPALGSRDAKANPLSNAFDFDQQPLSCRRS